MKWKIASITLILFYFPSFSFAQNNLLCSKDGYTVLTINGMFTEKERAILNRDDIDRRLPDSHKNQPVTVDYLMNPSHLAGVGDMLAVAYQKLFDSEKVEDYDLVEMINDASQKVRTQKLLLIAHSQGNFYANSMYYGLVGESGGVPAQSMGIYGVATPASHVAGGGKYITSSTDKLINNLRVADVLSILPNNDNILLPEGDISNGHGFSTIYLKYRGDKIVADIKASLDKLKNNYDQAEGKPCINPPELTLGHKIAKITFAVADPLAIAGKKAANQAYAVGVAIRDTTTYAANSLFAFSKYIADAVGGLGSKNNATLVLGDVSVNENLEINKNEAFEEKTQPKEEKPPKPKVAEEVTREVEKEEVKVPTRPVFMGTSNDSEQESNEIEQEPEPDTTPPDIEIIGREIMTIEINSVYTDAGANAEDDVDGVITVVVNGTVDTSTAGIYEVTYTATDLSGNSDQASRIVRVDNGAALNGPNSISIQEDYAYISSDDGSVEIVDISNPSSPRHVSYILSGQSGASLNQPKSISVQGDYAYVVSSGFLEIFDISNPVDISLISQLKNSDLGSLRIKCPAVIAVADDYAYIGSGDCGNSNAGELDIVDISDSGSPVLSTWIQATNIPMSNYPRSLFVLDDYLYQVVARGDYFQIFDISNPSLPQSEIIMNDGLDGAVIRTPSSVFVDGDYAYIASAGADTIQILDVSDPTVPIYKGKIQNGDGGADISVPVSIFVEDGYAYVVSNGSEVLEIIDVSDPANPVHVGKISDGTSGAELGDARAVVVEGDYAFLVARSGDTLEVIDISDPANPVHAGKLSHGGF